MGTCPITSELLCNYDAFIMTSLNEGMPISLIESIASGVPCILNDLPELRETAGDSAIYYKTNSVTDLREIIAGLMANKIQLKRLSERCSSLKNRYNIDNYVLNLMNIYSQ